MKTCLLDLNFTLVGNSDQKLSPFIRQIEAETYRVDLIERLRDMGARVILVTARPADYAKATLHSIESKTGWHPDAAYFNDLNLPPPALKEAILRDRLLPHYEVADLFAVESNPRTRGVYARYGVRSETYAAFMASALTTTG